MNTGHFIALQIDGDTQADAMYIHLSELPIAYSKELSSTVVGDFAEDGRLVGIDVQEVSGLSPAEEDDIADPNPVWRISANIP
jgi:uncharacterized protein YuzE